MARAIRKGAMNKLVLAFGALFSASSIVSAAPTIDFTGLGWPSFNSTGTDNTSFAGIAISGFTYTAPSTYAQNSGFLWLRNNADDHGLGYCSDGTNCGAADTTGNGDYNEVSNEFKNEVIRLTRPTGKAWTDIEVSSLDTGGTNNNEMGTFYWSNSATPNLNNTTNLINFSHNGLGWNTTTEEGSIFSYLVAHGFDVNAQYVFFRGGGYDSAGTLTNGTNDDYLVWGVNVAAIPEPETYAMLLAGLGLLGFSAQRRNLKLAA